MNQIRIGAGTVLLAAAIAACGGPEDKKGAAGGSAGTAGSARGGFAGSAGTTGVMLGIGGTGGDGGPATIPLTPPAKIDLMACKSISDDGTSQSVGDCFLCCNQAGRVNSGFFQGSCACGAEIEGRTVCAAQTSGGECQTCCDAANYFSSGFSPGPPASCECDGHADAQVCAAQTSRANCAVCCLNAGYVTSGYAGACACFDG